jgi:hypothetical protein
MIYFYSILKLLVLFINKLRIGNYIKPKKKKKIQKNILIIIIQILIDEND